MLVTQSCPTLCDLMDYSLPGFSVHEISQVRILKWVAISFSRGSSWPRDPTWVSCITGRFFTVLISMVYNRWYSSNMVQRTDYNWLTTLPTNAVYYIFPLIKFISCSAKSCSKTAQTWYYSVVTSKQSLLSLLFHFFPSFLLFMLKSVCIFTKIYLHISNFILYPQISNMIINGVISYFISRMIFRGI